MYTLKLVVGWVLTVFVGALGLLILWRISSGKLSLDSLIEDENGKASLSRFQFLIFTFVIAMSLFLVIVGQDPPSFPETIPGEVFALLGIIQTSVTIFF